MNVNEILQWLGPVPSGPVDPSVQSTLDAWADTIVDHGQITKTPGCIFIENAVGNFGGAVLYNEAGPTLTWCCAVRGHQTWTIESPTHLQTCLDDIMLDMSNG